MTDRFAEIIGLIKKEVKPALGCTEPIAVALAVAKAVEIIEDKCACCSKDKDWRERADFNVRVAVSGNILKNGMGVGIPGTGMVGLYIAAALGAVCGKSAYGLEVLHDLDNSYIARAKELVEQKRVKIELADTDKKLYIKASVRINDEHCASAVIENDHDNIVETYFDDNILASSRKDDGDTGEHRETKEYGLTVKEICDFARDVDFDDISFILESRDLNLALSEEGLKGDYGLKVGKTIHCSKHLDVFGNDFMSYAMAMTAAASDDMP